MANFFNITQPSVSTAIKRLESFFNTTLVIRGTTHSIISFTDAGKQLYQHTQSILNEINSTKMELTRLKQHTTIIGLPPIIKNAFLVK
ncbi:LysR family transcriptional regulator [Leuconostoc palmae]|uniref:LysR family transcriptional regulator n=1 Tax=Leuconostoc palmae TaxID=501487 RepID=UPI001FE35002|nr:LysR family transcriptional regulator [Leuconostoc palmae]